MKEARNFDWLSAAPGNGVLKGEKFVPIEVKRKWQEGMFYFTGWHEKAEHYENS